MPTLEFEKEALLKLTSLDEEKLFDAVENLKGEVKGNGERLLIELTPEREDMFTVYGLSRAIKSFFLKQKRVVGIALKSSDYEILNRSKLRPFVCSFIAKGVKIDELELKILMNDQENLHKTVGKDRKAAAIGIHDLDKIQGRKLVYEDVKEGYFHPLGEAGEMPLSEVLVKTEKGRQYSNLVSEFPVYKDEKGIFSFPPILNSERTRVTSSTRNLFVEITGTEKNATWKAFVILVADMIDRGADIYIVNVSPNHFEKEMRSLAPQKIAIDAKSVKEINKMLGLSLSKEEVLKCLERMGYETSQRDFCLAPFYRSDILHFYDIVEDVAIGYGFSKFIPELPKLPTKGRLNPITLFERSLVGILIGNGYQEVRTLGLASKESQKWAAGEDEIIELQNPVSKELSVYRASLIPNLLIFLSKNKHRQYPQKIFEIGYVAKAKENELYTYKNLCAAVSKDGATLEEGISLLKSISSALSVEIALEPADAPIFIKGRQAKVFFKTKSNGEEHVEEVGVIGEVSLEALEYFKIDLPVVVFEITYKKFDPL